MHARAPLWGVLVAAFLMGCPRAAAPAPGDEPSEAEPSPPVSDLDETPPREGAELLGTQAPEFEAKRWVNSDPLKLSDLRGQVVLIRFWTNTCPFCEASAPALARLHSRYASKGLKVIGFYHPKPPREEPVSEVRAAAKRLGMEFPIALDNEWRTLRRYWLDTQRGYTSVSFLIDKKGVFRHIHPGPEFHPDPSGEHPACDEDFRRMEAWVRRLLDEEPG